jgi:hypothetical protein
MDATGKTAVAPSYDDEGHFFNGLARVRIGTRWGFINEAGLTAIPPRFEDAGDFRGTLAPVRVGKRWGYIDRTGRTVVTPAYQGAAAFVEGLARVESWESIQCRNSVAYGNPPDYVYHIQSDIRHDMNNTCFPLNSRVGYIDVTGHFSIAPRFVEAHDFSDGLAVVRMEASGRLGFIDHSGAVVIPFQFDDARALAQGLAAVHVGRRTVNGIRDPGRWGFIDRTGKFVIRAQFAEAGDFSDGLALVSFWDRQGNGYIDKSGKLAIAVQYTWAEPFSEGLAKVCNEVSSSLWRCKYIDTSARVVIDSVQAEWPFSGGLAIAHELSEMKEPSGQAVYIDRTGRVIAPAEIRNRPLR